MINKRYAEKYCREDISKIENYEKAISDTTQTWVCHHRDEVKILPSGIKVVRSVEELKENGRYYNCPANELIFLTSGEHYKLHHKGTPRSEETKRRMSESKKGNKNAKGKTKSEFGREFKAHYGKTKFDDINLYNRECRWYQHHYHRCSWEVENDDK